MNLPILSYIHTREDRAYVLERLLILEQQAFNLNASFEVKAHELFSLPLAESIIEDAKASQVSFSDAQSVQKYVSGLTDALHTLSEVTVTLSFLPTNDLIRSISKWIDDAVGQKTILSVTINPAIGGGVIVEWSGKYIDYSLKKLIEQQMGAQKSKNT